MDTFAHGALSMVCFSRSGLRRLWVAPEKPPLRDWTLWAALGFGTLPDLSSFGAYLIQRIVDGDFTPGKPAIETMPSYVFTNYNISHSLVVALAVGIILAFTCRQTLLPFAAWPLHILCDIPMHGRDYFATPVFWPFWSWNFDGWGFSRYPAMIIGYWLAIAILFAVTVKYGKKWAPPQPAPGQ